MAIITWIIVGFLAGVIVNILDERATEERVFGAITLGIVGAATSAVLAALFFGVTSSSATLSTVISMIGAGLLLAISRGMLRIR